MPSMTTCLWFEHEAREAAEHYVGIVPNSRILAVSPGAGPVSVEFELDGAPFLALDGRVGPGFTEAVSLVTAVDTQAELDARWDRLVDGGRPVGGGWLVDRFGVSWQVVPRILPRLLHGHPARAARVAAALRGMQRLDIAALQEAADDH